MDPVVVVRVEDYLTTAYRPDCDYVDGVLVERNGGELDHSDLQGEIIAWFRVRRKALLIHAFPEQRVQVSATRYRVPDICLVVGQKPAEPILVSPPFVVIEILSKDDRVSQMQERIDDYLRMGVRYVWLIDPRARRAWSYTSFGIEEVRDGVLRTANPTIELPLTQIFESMES